MSGFFGIIRQDGRPVDGRFLTRIVQALSFRGPDGQNTWTRFNVGACFTFMRTGPARQASRQPVTWEDRYWLWGDVRLDGREELQGQLSDIGFAAESESTNEELLLRAWAAWGESCLERVIGDFSFALWDCKEKGLWCARDFVGARPFFYGCVGQILCFSNTLEILRQVPDISGELDEEFLGDFLVEGWNVEPARTVYRDIRRLPAGHAMKFSDGRLEVRRFRKLPIEETLQLKRKEEYLEAYIDLLKTAVNDRLPKSATSLYLSGGLDSSSVCAIAAKIAEQRSQKEKLTAYTLSWEGFFDDPEPKFATITSNYLGIIHEVLTETELLPFHGAETEEGRIPEPDQEIFFARERRHSQRIASHSNVVLAGDGGDNILTGQGWPYLVHLWERGEWREIGRQYGGYFWTHKRLPPMRGGFRKRLTRLWITEDPFVGYPEWLNDEFTARINLRQRWLELRNRKRNPEHPLHPVAYEALHSGYWAEVLEMEDAGWNRVNLETRAPLLDLRILRFLLRLPPVPWCIDKELCRKAMKDWLPGVVLERPKSPLAADPLKACAEGGGWISRLPQAAPESLKKFVNWHKWCETFYRSKGSLNWLILRPVSLLYWLKAVENGKRIK